MSLSDFSEVAKARIAMKNNTGGVATIVDAWTDAMENRIKVGASQEKLILGKAVVKLICMPGRGTIEIPKEYSGPGILKRCL